MSLTLLQVLQEAQKKQVTERKTDIHVLSSVTDVDSTLLIDVIEKPITDSKNGLKSYKIGKIKLYSDIYTNGFLLEIPISFLRKDGTEFYSSFINKLNLFFEKKINEIKFFISKKSVVYKYRNSEYNLYRFHGLLEREQ